MRTQINYYGALAIGLAFACLSAQAARAGDAIFGLAEDVTAAERGTPCAGCSDARRFGSYDPGRDHLNPVLVPAPSYPYGWGGSPWGNGYGGYGGGYGAFYRPGFYGYGPYSGFGYGGYGYGYGYGYSGPRILVPGFTQNGWNATAGVLIGNPPAPLPVGSFYW